MLVEVKTKGTKEINEVGESLKSIMLAVAAAKKDGWQPGSDIPAVVTAALISLPKAIDGLSGAKDEAKAHPVEAVIGALVPVAEGIGALLADEQA